MNVRRLLLTTFFNIQILFLGTARVVSGNYNVNITLESYTNDGRCATCREESDESPGCCDNFESTNCGTAGVSSSQCETYFQFCLLSPGTSTSSRSPVSCAAMATSSHTDNGAFIDFSQSTVLGLSNPVSLSGTMISPTWMGVIVQILPYDFDTSSADDLIDVFRFTISSRSSGSTILPGAYGLSQLGYRYEIICADRYYGDNCEFFDDCPSPDVCGPNGVCIDRVDGYECQCDPMYTGSHCDVTLSPCQSMTCNGNGQCVDVGGNSFTCTCDPGYTGATCDTNINECSGVDCNGNGQCMDGIDSYTCMCDVGFTGVDCSINIDDCARIDCGEQGQCMDGIDSYTCQCNAGFTGQDCSVNIDDCAGINCSGQGQCLDGVNSYTCDCDFGHTGDECQVEINLCDAVNCSGRGRCQDELTSFTCVCEAGFTGADCSTDIDDCNGVDCGEKSQCMDGLNSYTCVCFDGYAGDNCTININDCLGVTCGGNGRCVDGVNSYRCICDAGHTGNECEIQSEGLGVDDHDHLMFALIIGGSMGGFILLLILVFLGLVVAILCFCRSRIQQKKRRSTGAVLDRFKIDRLSIDLTCNEGYGGVCPGMGPEEIYDEIAIDSRHHGVYEGAPETESYVIYDVVL